MHAITDAATLALADFGVRAAAIAGAGSAVALHARNRTATAAELVVAAAQLVALAAPAEASVFVNGRPDLAAAIGAQGVQLAADDLVPADAKLVLRDGWVGRSVHSVTEAEAAVSEGADYLMAGTVYPTASHPGRSGGGTALVRELATLGVPVIAIGGITAARAAELRDAGAWGVAAISALWHAADPAAAALDLLGPWLEMA